MDENNVAVLAILDDQCASTVPPYKQQNIEMTGYATVHHSQPMHHQEEVETSETSKQNIIWTRNATLTLLNLYETKMHMWVNPKKKTKMWSSMAEELRALNVEVTPDQVRWKINALTKKYKDCIDNGQAPMSFKYFNEMHQILGQHSNESGTYRLASGVMQEDGEQNTFMTKKKAIPFRRLRMEQRAKIDLDKQWMEYLGKQEMQKQIRDERYERNLRLREEELQLRKREMEIKQSLALKKLQLKERKQEEMLKIEREKCALLRKLLTDC